MNYLAHLHIADITGTSVTGNLLGDFVRGRVEDLPFDEVLKQGIRLHRAVDTFTDQHEAIGQLKRDMGPHRRYAGIILDVLFDHHLARNFQNFHSLSLELFSQDIYQRIDTQDTAYPERFVMVCQRMQQMDWLTGYRQLANIERALNGIGQRLKRPVDLAAALDWHQTQYQHLDEVFHAFYIELLAFAQSQASNS